MTAGQHIDYDALALEALRGVVKGCLAQVARTGLVGDHHFYIAFNTQAPGVGMSRRLKEKYPDEMTIVLQHRFWDLSVEDERFEVKLTFDSIPERLVIPFKAIKVFYDPSVPYGLQFEEVQSGGAPDLTRRTARRTMALAKDGDAKSGATPVSAAPRGPGRDGAGSGEEPERDDRRRPTPARRSRPGERVASDKPMAVDDDAERVEERQQDRERPAAPAAARTPAVAAVASADAAQDKPGPADGAAGKGRSEGDAASGAKIFDLAKFRGSKK